MTVKRVGQKIATGDSRGSRANIRQAERGYFWQVFGEAENTAYVSDNQFVLKNRKDIQVNTFYLNLSKATTIQVPINTTGNIAGLYKELGNDSRYFKVVDMNDASLKKDQFTSRWVVKPPKPLMTW